MWFYAFLKSQQAGLVSSPCLLLNLVILGSIAYSHPKIIITQYIKWCWQNTSYVVFKPSSLVSTTDPVTVLVKVSANCTNVTVETNDKNVVVGARTINGDMYEYKVNTKNVGANYRVIVKYTDGTESKMDTYDVDVYTGS